MPKKTFNAVESNNRLTFAKKNFIKNFIQISSQI